jgi:hypothetical protein
VTSCRFSPQLECEFFGFVERPKGSTNHPLIPLSYENIAFAEDLDVNPAIHENDFILHFLDRLRAGASGP